MTMRESEREREREGKKWKNERVEIASLLKLYTHFSELILLLSSDRVVAGFDVAMQNANVVQIFQRFETLST